MKGIDMEQKSDVKKETNVHILCAKIIFLTGR